MAMSLALGGSSFTTRSPIRIVPLVMASSPETILRAVVLPHPEGPTRTMNSLSAMSSSRARTASVPSPNTFQTSCRTISATAVPRAPRAGWRSGRPLDQFQRHGAHVASHPYVPLEDAQQELGAQAPTVEQRLADGRDPGIARDLDV